MAQIITKFCYMVAEEYICIISKAFNCFVEILDEFLCQQLEVNELLEPTYIYLLDWALVFARVSLFSQQYFKQPQVHNLTLFYIK